MTMESSEIESAIYRCVDRYETPQSFVKDLASHGIEITGKQKLTGLRYAVDMFKLARSYSRGKDECIHAFRTSLLSFGCHISKFTGVSSYYGK